MLVFPGLGLSIEMQYRGKHYIVVQGIEPESWKWTVDLDEHTSRAGEAKTRGLALSASFCWSTSISHENSSRRPPDSSRRRIVDCGHSGMRLSAQTRNPETGHASGVRAEPVIGPRFARTRWRARNAETLAA